MARGTLGPCILEGELVRLEPLRKTHAEPLFEAARTLDWEWFLTPLRTKSDVYRRIAQGTKSERRDEAYAFAVRLKGGRIVGSTSYLNVVTKQKRAEIGATWYAPDSWGTAVNPECKLLLLRHAFEDWGAVRVQLVTDVNNHHSQRAILKLGAVFEGKLRNYGIRPDGSKRDTMVYSITESEWPAVKSKLFSRLEKFARDG